MSEPAAAARRRREAPARGGTLRDEQKRLTRRRLADAALELFEEQGYAATTAEHIATRAGANRATFYLHFAGKVEVVLELMARLDDEVAATFGALDALGPPTRAAVRAWLEETVGFWRRHRVVIDANEQALGVEGRVAEYWVGGLDRAVDAMPRHLARFHGADRRRERVRLTALMMGLERLCYFWIVVGTPMDPDDVMDALTDQWWLVMAPDRA